MSTYEVLAQLMEDMSYPQPTEIRQAIRAEPWPGTTSIMRFHFSVVIVPQLAAVARPLVGTRCGGSTRQNATSWSIVSRCAARDVRLLAYSAVMAGLGA